MKQAAQAPATQTYVVFSYPGLLAAEEETRKVASRDIAKLKIPKGALGFQFHDVASITVNGEKLTGEAKNLSKLYMVADEVITRGAAVKKYPADHMLQMNTPHGPSQQLARYGVDGGNYWFAIPSNAVVIGRDKKLLHGKPDATLKSAFNAPNPAPKKPRAASTAKAPRP